MTEQVAAAPVPLSVQLGLVGVAPPPLAVKLTLPAGVEVGAADVSLTVAVHVLVPPVAIEPGRQLRLVVVVRALTVIEPPPELTP